MGARIKRQERDSSGDTPHQIVGVAIYVASLFFHSSFVFFLFSSEGLTGHDTLRRQQNQGD